MSGIAGEGASRFLYPGFHAHLSRMICSALSLGGNQWAIFRKLLENHNARVERSNTIKSLTLSMVDIRAQNLPFLLIRA